MTLKDLEKLANEATPGPWKATCRDIGNDDDNFDWVGWEHSGLGWEIKTMNGECLPEPMRGMLDRGWDAAYIAAHNPERMKRIYDLLKQYVPAGHLEDL